MHKNQSLRILAKRPLCSPGFTRKLLIDLNIAESFHPSQILYLTPNKRKARRAMFEILSLYKGKALKPPYCLDLLSLASQLVISAGKVGITDEQDRRYLLLKLIRESANPVFSKEHLRLLSNLYAQLRRYHPDGWSSIPELARQEIYDLDAAQRLEEAIRLLQTYEQFLKSHRLCDHEQLLAEAENLISNLKHRLVIIEGYFQPWAAEKELFSRILAQIPEAVVILPQDEAVQKGEEFFSSLGLRKHPAPSPKTLPPSTWQRFASREDEVTGIARRISALAQKGVRPSDITVVFGDLHAYRPIIERVFARYRLSPWLSMRERLASFPSVNQVLNLLKVPGEGFRRRDVVNLLLSPNFANVPPEVRRWIDVISREEGIISGRSSWNEWFLSEVPYRLKDYPKASYLAKKMRGFIRTFIRRLAELERPSTIKEFCTRLENVLSWLGWDTQDKVRQGFRKILSKLVRIFELSGQEIVKPVFAAESLEILLQAEVEPDEGDERDIRVIPVVESRWLDTPYLFLGGMVDGEFPRRPERDLLLPEKLHHALGIPTIEEEFSNQEFEFRRLLTMAQKKVFLSAPWMEANRPLLASVFLAEREEDAEPPDPTLYCLEEAQALEPVQRNPQQQGVMLTDPPSLDTLSENFDKEYPFKVTLLEIYRSCPYRYYLRAVLGLEPFEEPTPEPEARLLGTVLHQVLSRVLAGSADSLFLDEKLITELDAELAGRRLNPFVKTWIRDWVGARADWFRDTEQARAEEGWEVDPSWLERNLNFSFEPEGFSLKGRVDRVDWKQDKARVLDYKTGKEKGFERKVKKGESLQLPLYSEMIERSADADIEEFGIYGFAQMKIMEVDNPDAAMSAAKRFAAQAVQGIREGRFQAEENPACCYCEFKELCT